MVTVIKATFKLNSIYVSDSKHMRQSDRVLYQMIWPPQAPALNPVQTVWDKLDHLEGKVANKWSAYMGTPSRLVENPSR